MAGAPKPEAAEAAAPLFGTPMADPFPSLGESESVAVPTKASGGNGGQRSAFTQRPDVYVPMKGDVFGQGRRETNSGLFIYLFFKARPKTCFPRLAYRMPKAVRLGGQARLQLAAAALGRR